MSIRTQGDFDKGTLEIKVKEYSVISLTLCELNQHHEGFREYLMYRLSNSYKTVYELGRKHGQEELLDKINKL